MVRKLADNIIRKCFYAKGNPWYSIPFYRDIFGYTFCMYAMHANWDSLRIKFEKHDCTKRIVIKKGQY